MKYQERLFRWLRGPLGVLVAAVIILFGVVTYAQIANKNSKTDILQVNGRSFSLQIAKTEQERELGLGNRTSLPTDQGMLFVFPQVQPECFWMKDMHFSLDMVWVDANKKVVYIKHDVSPNTYPDSFCPTQPVGYVIELNAGMTDNTGMKVGETLDF
jgi:uncharacterized protein